MLAVGGALCVPRDSYLPSHVAPPIFKAGSSSLSPSQATSWTKLLLMGSWD